MIKWTALLIIGLGLTACQTTAYQEKFDRMEPKGASVRSPFDVMVANAEQPKLHIGSVYFAFDNAVLTDESKLAIRKYAQGVNQLNGAVIIEGHASYENTESYNQTLGFKRALAVAEYLRDAGVWEERLHIKSFGKSRPSADNHDENFRQENRRVEIKMLAQGDFLNGKEAVQLQSKLTQPTQETSAAPSPLAGLMQLMGGESK